MVTWKPFFIEAIKVFITSMNQLGAPQSTFLYIKVETNENMIHFYAFENKHCLLDFCIVLSSVYLPRTKCTCALGKLLFL